MGGSISYHENSDSIVDPGTKSIISDPISVDPDKLFAGTEAYIRNGKMKNRETEFEMSEKDGWWLIKHVYTIPDLFGGGTHTVYNRYKFDAPAKTLQHEFFAGQVFMDKGTPNFSSKTVIHSDGRVENCVDFHEVRSSGPLLKGLLEKVIGEMGSKAKVQANQPSVKDEGSLSALTDPIDDATVTADTYLDFFKTFLTETMQATELPDGTIIEERTGMMDLLGLGAKSFSKHVLKKEENHIYCYEYGQDESLTEMISVTHFQIHKDPFRLEAWNIQVPGRRAGTGQATACKNFMDAIMKSMEEGA